MPLLRLRRASLLAVTFAAAFACGEKFKASDTTGGGTAGTGHVGDAGEGGTSPGASSGGRGGSGAVGGSGGAVAGQSGASMLSGSAGREPGEGDAGEAGAGGQPPVVPAIPTDALELWFRADEGVTAAASGAVSVWKDLSGHTRDATQSAANYRPMRLERALAGRPALVFDGADDFLKLPPLDVDFSAGVSIFIAMEQHATTYCDPYFEASTDSEVNDLHFGNWQDTLLYEIEDDTVQDSAYPLLLQQPQIAVAVQAADGWVQLRRNGNGVGERKADLPGDAERTQVFIGRSLYENCAVFDGSIGELLLYSRGLGDAELLRVEQYLQDKWGCCAGEP